VIVPKLVGAATKGASSLRTCRQTRALASPRLTPTRPASRVSAPGIRQALQTRSRLPLVGDRTAQVLGLVLVLSIHVWQLRWVGRPAVPLETLGGPGGCPEPGGR